MYSLDASGSVLRLAIYPALILSVSSLIIISLLTPKPEEEKWRLFLDCQLMKNLKEYTANEFLKLVPKLATR
jgi:hypothetical protein